MSDFWMKRDEQITRLRQLAQSNGVTVIELDRMKYLQQDAKVTCNLPFVQTDNTLLFEPVEVLAVNVYEASGKAVMDVKREGHSHKFLRVVHTPGEYQVQIEMKECSLEDGKE